MERKSTPHMHMHSIKGLEILLKEFNVKTVLEYGAGYSTYFFADRVKRVYTVEHNPEWQPEPTNNITCILTQEPKEYVEGIVVMRTSFDLVLIDCLKKFRPIVFDFVKKLDWKVLCVHDWGRDKEKYDYECYKDLEVREYGSLNCFIK